MKASQWTKTFGLFLIWVLLSFEEVFKTLSFRLGLAVCILFPIVSAAALSLLRKRIGPRVARNTALALAAGWGFAAVAYGVLHPLSARHVFGPGSDRENAIQVACHALFSGNFPYRKLTFLQHPITPMPGALFIAAPFYLIGSIGLQNLVWLAAFLYWCYRCIGKTWVSAWYVFVFILFCPCIMQDFVTGGDFFTNFVYVVVILTALTHSLQKARPHWGIWVWPLLMGIALASRPIYSLVYPCLLAFAWQVAGRRAAVQTVGLALAAELGVTLPIYFRDPAHFTPFNVGSNAYSLIPAALHPAVVTFAFGLMVASVSFFVRLNLHRLLLILGCALTLVTLPFFIADRLIQPELFPLINLIYLSPGLLLLAISLLPPVEGEQRTAENRSSAA